MSVVDPPEASEGLGRGAGLPRILTGRWWPFRSPATLRPGEKPRRWNARGLRTRTGASGMPMMPVAAALGAGAILLFACAAQAPAGHASAAPVEHVVCGQGWHGLGVVAVTSRGEQACAMAHRVTSAMGEALESEFQLPVAVTVDGADWICGGKESDSNPYIECVREGDPSELVQLLP